MYINREMEKTLLEAWQYFPVLTVTGPRQSGKSTLLKHLFPDAVAFSLKDIQVRDFALSDPVAFLGQTDRPLFIDEIQKAPALIEYIQGIVDNHPERKFLLSGSSQFEVMKGVSESLAGRSGVYELMPMSFSETREISARKDMESLLFDGFYPAVCAGKNIASVYYPSYVRTYLEKDVRNLLNIKDMMQFHRFMKLCAARVGSIFNATELSGEVGVDSKVWTVRRLHPGSPSYRLRILSICCRLTSRTSPSASSSPRNYISVIPDWRVICWISRARGNWPETRCGETSLRTSS